MNIVISLTLISFILLILKLNQIVQLAILVYLIRPLTGAGINVTSLGSTLLERNGTYYVTTRLHMNSFIHFFTIKYN